MGLDGFLAFTRKKYPDVILTEHITLYSHQRLFMDIASYIYKYICVFGNNDTKWLECMFQMFLNLKSYKVHVVPIFDGVSPIEKQGEVDDRKEKRLQIKNKAKLLEQAVEGYKNKSLSDEQEQLIRDVLTDLEKKNKSSKLKSLLFQKTKSLSPKIENISDIDIVDIETYICSLKKTMFYVGSKETDLIKEMLSILGIPYIQAPQEAEACCSTLCKMGYGSAVISCDTDCFAHGCPCTVLSYDVSSGMITTVKMDELLEQMELTQDEFIDFSILIGCDYNKKTKLKNVGPVKALELIKKYRKIELIEGYNIEQMEYKKIRLLFNNIISPKSKLLRIKPHTNIDKKALNNFTDEYNIRCNYNRLKELMKEYDKTPEIQFLENEDTF